MKRIICIIALFTVILSLLASCEFPTESDPTCDKINALIKGTPYSGITLTTCVEDANGLSTTAVYTLTDADGGVRIDYTVEQLVYFEINGDSITESSEYKKTAVGYAIVNSEGVVTKQEGAVIDLNATVGWPKFNLKPGDFKDIFEEPNSYVCVTDSSSDWCKFTPGISPNTSLVVTIENDGSFVSSITMEYTTENLCKVTQTYSYN